MLKKKEFSYPSADKKTKIHAVMWKPESEIRAVLQICHGMVEYIDRYDRFASFLAEQGFLVVGNDHLGHGASVTSDEEHGYFGHPDGNRYVIADIHHLRTAAQKKYPDVPYFMLGHSMGSFLLRQYLTLHGEGLTAAIIMGTGSQPRLILTAGKLICRAIALFRGWHFRSDLVDGMAFGGYNKKFEPARTDNDWLTKDSAIVDAYCADPWCTFQFTVNGYYQMFTGIEAAQKNVGSIPKDLPLLIVSGAEDPVGNFGKGVKEVYENCREAGIKDVSIKLYPDDRHEILNETDYRTVYADLLKWMEKYSAS